MQNNQPKKSAKIQEYSAGVIVFHELAGIRQYLLLHYPGGHYDFPKGHLEAGENNYQAAIRELEEETGITAVEIIQGFEEKLDYSFRRMGKIVNKTVVFFLGKTSSDQVKLSFEHQGHIWLDYDNALRQITFENARELLRRAEKFLSKTK